MPPVDFAYHNYNENNVTNKVKLETHAACPIAMHASWIKHF